MSILHKLHNNFDGLYHLTVILACATHEPAQSNDCGPLPDNDIVSWWSNAKETKQGRYCSI